jgi:plastocyanin
MLRISGMLLLAVLLPGAHAEEPARAVFLIEDYHFQPLELTVPVGTRVTWTNQGEDAHTVVSDSGLFRSGGLDTGESFSFTFDKAGTYHFTCSVHPRMVGTVIVRAPLAGARHGSTLPVKAGAAAENLKGI